MQAMGLINDHVEGCAIRAEVERARAITHVAGRAIEVGRLKLDVARLVTEYPNAPWPAGLLGGGGNGGGGDR